MTAQKVRTECRPSSEPHVPGSNRALSPVPNSQGNISRRTNHLARRSPNSRQSPCSDGNAESVFRPQAGRIGRNATRCNIVQSYSHNTDAPHPQPAVASIRPAPPSRERSCRPRRPAHKALCFQSNGVCLSNSTVGPPCTDLHNPAHFRPRSTQPQPRPSGLTKRALAGKTARPTWSARFRYHIREPLALTPA